MPYQKSSPLVVLALGLGLTWPASALAQAPSEGDQDPAIQRLVDNWYVEQCAGENGRPHRLMAPAGIDASPAYRYRDTGSAALAPRYYVSLAATMPLVRYEVVRVRADPRYARVQVRERGYRYASAADVTYELMSDTVLVVERQDDGRWLVLAHETHGSGFPQSLATRPLPDLGPNGRRPEVRCARFDPDEHAG